MILDSTFLNDLLRGDSDAAERLETLIDSRTPVAISTLTVFEVGVGLRGAARSKRERFNELIDELEVVPLGLKISRRALEVQRRLMDNGQRIGAVDVLIAATAVVRGEPVLTRNVGEFRRVGGIVVADY